VGRPSAANRSEENFVNKESDSKKKGKLERQKGTGGDKGFIRVTGAKKNPNKGGGRSA